MKCRVTFKVPAEVVVDMEVEVVDPEDPDAEDEAADLAWQKASDYLLTLLPDGRGSAINIDLDGIGAETVEVTR